MSSLARLDAVLAVLERHGVTLTLAGVRVFVRIAQANGPLPMQTLAEDLGLSRPNVSRVIDELSRSRRGSRRLGLVIRSDHPESARKKRVKLSRRGRAVAEEVRAALEDRPSDSSHSA